MSGSAPGAVPRAPPAPSPLLLARYGQPHPLRPPTQPHGAGSWRHFSPCPGPRSAPPQPAASPLRPASRSLRATFLPRRSKHPRRRGLFPRPGAEPPAHAGRSSLTPTAAPRSPSPPLFPREPPRSRSPSRLRRPPRCGERSPLACTNLVLSSLSRRNRSLLVG